MTVMLADAGARDVVAAARRRLKLRRPRRWLLPLGQERQFYRDLAAMIMRAEARVLALLPRLARELVRARKRQPGADSVADADVDVQSIGERIRDAFPAARGREIAAEVAAGTSSFNKAQFRQVVQSVVGVQPLVAEPWLGEALRAGTREMRKLITSIPQRLETEVEGLFMAAMRTGVRAEALEEEVEAMLKADIRGRFDVARSRAKLIARDQVSKLNGNLTRLRQQGLGLDRYIWRTSRDERVREEHAEREGQVYSWGDPPEDGHPGEPIQCRCTAEAVFGPLLEALEE